MGTTGGPVAGFFKGATNYGRQLVSSPLDDKLVWPAPCSLIRVAQACPRVINLIWGKQPQRRNSAAVHCPYGLQVLNQYPSDNESFAINSVRRPPCL